MFKPNPLRSETFKRYPGGLIEQNWDISYRKIGILIFFDVMAKIQIWLYFLTKTFESPNRSQNRWKYDVNTFFRKITNFYPILMLVPSFCRILFTLSKNKISSHLLCLFTALKPWFSTLIVLKNDSFFRTRCCLEMMGFRE